MSGYSASPKEAAAFSPLYRQIKELLVRSLHEGEWKPGESIPSELDLAARFRVSQGTVRKAIDELAAEKVLIRRQGKGTFVATHHEAEVRYRFLNLRPNESASVKPAYSKVLSCTVVKANEQQAKQLDIFAGSDLIHIQRMLWLDDKPTVVDRIWLCGDVFSGLTLEKLVKNKAPLYGFFESEFGVSMVRAEEKIRAILADQELADRLNVTTQTPLLEVERISYTYGDRPIEIRQGFYLTKHYHYRNSLN